MIMYPAMSTVTHEMGQAIWEYPDCLSNGIYRIWVSPPSQ